jgi:hypothetical protein
MPYPSIKLPPQYDACRRGRVALKLNRHFRANAMSALGRGCVKTRKKIASKKFGLSGSGAIEFFESGNGQKTPEIARN